MPITLAQAALNTQDDLDANIINEFRGTSALLDALDFHQAVSPMGGGSTLTYGYHRVLTTRAAAFRAINSEYTPAQATKARFNVDLKPLGGSYEIDRVLAQIARGAEVSFQIRELVQASVAKWTDEVINGDIAVDAAGFDGLDKALTGSTTEVTPNADTTAITDWSALTNDGSHLALDVIDEFLSVMDGTPTALIGNRFVIAKLRAIARRANQFVARPVDGLTRDGDRPVVREFFNETTMLIDAGDKPASTSPVIPVEDRDVADTPDGGTITGLTDLYAVRTGMTGFHAVATTGDLLQSWLPDFTEAGAVKLGEVEIAPNAVVLKATKAAAVLRNIKVR